MSNRQHTWIELQIHPTPSAQALRVLAKEGRQAGLSKRFVKSVRNELREIKNRLDPVRDCLEQLEQAGTVTVKCPDPPRHGARTGLEWLMQRQPVTVKWSPKTMANRMASEKTYGPWHDTVFTLLELLEILEEPNLPLSISVLKNGRNCQTETVIASLTELLASTDSGNHRTRTVRRTERTDTSATRNGCTTTKTQSARRSRSTREANEANDRRRRRQCTGFGGLPDDAENERNTASGQRAEWSPDAEFFLSYTGIAWPCSRADLDRGRKNVIAQLHPDRAGEHRTRDFLRAMAGYNELVRKLTTDSVTQAYGTAPSCSSSPRATTVGHWP